MINHRFLDVSEESLAHGPKQDVLSHVQFISQQDFSIGQNSIPLNLFSAYLGASNEK